MSTLGSILEGLFLDGPIPTRRWGDDHYSTLLYLDTRVVDHRGLLHSLRIDTPAAPMGCDPHMRLDGRYPTRLRAPEAELRGHTDYDCLADAIAAGFLRVARTPDSVRHVRLRPFDPPPIPDEPTGDELMDQGNQIQYAWTEQGYHLIARLRRWRADGKQLREFEV